MFGLESQRKKKKIEEFVFDLEKELLTQKKHKEVKQRIESQIQKIKDILRAGENKADFDKLGILLQGYTSLLKVMSRFMPTSR